MSSLKLQLVSAGGPGEGQSIEYPTGGGERNDGYSLLGTVQLMYSTVPTTPDKTSNLSTKMQERVKNARVVPASPVEATGLCVVDELMVTLITTNSEEEERHVAILNKRLGVCRLFVDVHLNNPGYVVMSQGAESIYVTEEHRVLKLSLEGVIEAFAGSAEPGTNPLTFQSPSGMAFHPLTNQLYVADHSNHRVQVLCSSDLSYRFSFTMTPSFVKDACCPTDLAFDAEGILYIADDANNCIIKYSPDGQYISMFSSYGTEPGLLSEPTYLAIDKNHYVYVCEIEGDRISVFDTNGYFKYVIKTHERMCITGFDVNVKGDLYLCDYSQKRIFIV